MNSLWRTSWISLAGYIHLFFNAGTVDVKYITVDIKRYIFTWGNKVQNYKYTSQSLHSTSCFCKRVKRRQISSRMIVDMSIKLSHKHFSTLTYFLRHRNTTLKSYLKDVKKMCKLDYFDLRIICKGFFLFIFLLELI